MVYKPPAPPTQPLTSKGALKGALGAQRVKHRFPMLSGARVGSSLTDIAFEKMVLSMGLLYAPISIRFPTYFTVV